MGVARAERQATRTAVPAEPAEQGIPAASAGPERQEPAKAEPVVTAPNNGLSVPSQYFVDAVRREAPRWKPSPDAIRWAERALDA